MPGVEILGARYALGTFILFVHIDIDTGVKLVSLWANRQDDVLAFVM
jgi:hypothetical protein